MRVKSLNLTLTTKYFGTMFKKIFYLIIAIAFGVGVFYAKDLADFAELQKPAPKDLHSNIAKGDTLSLVEAKAPQILYGVVVDSMLVIDDVVKPNQNLSEILSKYNISFQVIDQLAKLSKEVFDVRKINAHKKYTLICAQDSLKTAQCFIYQPNPIEYIVFNLQDSLQVYIGEKEVEVTERTVAGEISTSLSDAMIAQGATHMLVNNFADIYGWQIDFFRLQKGDRFKLIVEEKHVGGQLVGYGDVKGAYFEHFGSPFYAIPFDQGDGLDYFDQEGKSLRKAFLKDPLEYTRISSRYSPKRFHPVLKRWKSHLGTDYAAPTGTPIRSVGDGIIVEARYNKGNGNYVKIKHNGTYTTQYLHMSRIAKGIRPGVKVRQGQNIGFVGSTGLATGPHLCYRFWKNGRQVDALRVELPPSKPILEENVGNYEVVKQDVTKKLDALKFPEQEMIASTNEGKSGTGTTANNKSVRMAR